MEVARGGHLVLSHVGDEDGLSLCGVGYFPYDLAHGDALAFVVQLLLDDGLLFLLLVWFEGLDPSLVAGWVDGLGEGGQGLFRVAQHLGCCLDVLVYLRRVDVHMDDLGLLRIGVRVTRHTVVEAHTDRDQHIALVGLHVGRYVAMHADESFVQPEVRRHGGKTQQRGCRRDICLLQELQELILRIAEHHSLTYYGEWLLRLVDQSCRLLDLLGTDVRGGDVASVVGASFVVEVRQLVLRILREVQHDWSGTSRGRYVEGLGDSVRYLVGTAYLAGPFGDRLRDAHHVYLLEGVRS